MKQRDLYKCRRLCDLLYDIVYDLSFIAFTLGLFVAISIVSS